MRRRQESLRRTLRVEGCTVRMSTVRASILPHPATGTIKTMHSDHRSGDSEVGYQAIPDHNGADVDVRSIPVNFNGRPGLASPRGRSKSLNVKLGSNVLVPEVGTASDVVLASDGLARDDMYMEGISLRRNFASEFVAMLEDDARQLFYFDDDDFGDPSEKSSLRPPSWLRKKTAKRSQAALSRVIVTFLKSMVGSYILYTPKMFSNGGLTASVLTLLVAAWVACDNMIVLIHLAEKEGKSTYGQLGFAAFGKLGQLMVDVSLVLSQLSFCCSYFIYIVLNIPSVAPIAAPGSIAEFVMRPDILIALQLLVYIPMAWIRHLKYLALAMFAANVCMWLGLFLITAIDAESLLQYGPEPVLNYNPDEFVLFLGAVVVCFEGIGLVLPLRDSMEPSVQHKFPGVVRVAMFFLAIVFSVFGAMGYLSYGENIKTFVTMNIPRGDPLGSLSVALYSVAIMMSYPLQLFPAIKCIEGRIFGGKREAESKTRMWQKNILRTFVVLLTAVVGRIAGPSFDNFAGLIGGFCAVPLALIYPTAFHLKIMADTLTTPQKLWDWLILFCGTFAAVLCTWQSLTTWK